MKRVLVTGAGGFLGRRVVDRLRRGGWSVVAAARSAGADVTIDLEDPFFLESLRRIDRCDAIVHAAAKVDFNASLGSLYTVNVSSTAALVALARSWEAHFVFCSSVAVLGARTARIDSSSPPAPDTAYAQSKWLSEEIVNAACVPATVLRFGGIFGADGPSHLGLNRSIAEILAGRAPVLSGPGRALRNYVYVKDAAAALVHALEERVLGVHLVAGRETLPIRDWLNRLCDAQGRGLRPSFRDGTDGADQVIVPSEALPPGLSVAEAMRDLRPIES